MTYRLWHRVLWHALLGVDPADVDADPGEQTSPDLDALAAVLTKRRSEVARCRDEAVSGSRPWPVPPSPELSDGLPWSQYATVLHQLRARLGFDGTHLAPGPDRPVADRETRRLIEDRPPHW